MKRKHDFDCIGARPANVHGYVVVYRSINYIDIMKAIWIQKPSSRYSHILERRRIRCKS